MNCDTAGSTLHIINRPEESQFLALFVKFEPHCNTVPSSPGIVVKGAIGHETGELLEIIFLVIHSRRPWANYYDMKYRRLLEPFLR